MSLFNRWPFSKGDDEVVTFQPKPTQVVDAEAARIANETQLRELGVSDKTIGLLHKHGHIINAKALTEQIHTLNKELEYEGFAPVKNAEQLLRAIITHDSLERSRDIRAAQLEKALQTIAPESLEYNITTKFVAELKTPLTLQDAILVLEAKKILKAKGGDQPPTDADLEQAVRHLKKQAWKRKANRLAHSQAQFLLKSTLKPNFKPHDESEETALALTKKFGEEVPPEQAIELARHIFDEYTKKHPFQG